MRLRPASSATSWKRRNERVTPASASELTVTGTAGPKNAVSTRAPACAITLCAPGYVGSAGVLASELQFGSATVDGLPSVAASRIAVIGRQMWSAYFAA